VAGAVLGIVARPGLTVVEPGLVACGVLVIGAVVVVGCVVLVVVEPGRAPGLVWPAWPLVELVDGVWPAGIVPRPGLVVGAVVVLGCVVLIAGELDFTPAAVAGVVACPAAEPVPVVPWPALGEPEVIAGVAEWPAASAAFAAAEVAGCEFVAP